MFPEYCVDQSNDREHSLNNTIYELSRMNLARAGGCCGGVDETVEEGADSAGGMCDDHPVEVIPKLYLGNAKSSANLDTLNRLGIRYILNVTTNMPNVYETDDSFSYMQVRIDDHWSQNLAAFFPQSINFIGK